MQKFSKVLLGCMSTYFLVGSVYAFEGCSSEQPVCFSALPDLRDITCGAEERWATFTITNTDDDGVLIEELFIEVNDDEDDFRWEDFVSVLPPFDADDCFYTSDESYILAPGSSCNVVVEIDPQDLDCDDQPLLPTGNVSRVLVANIGHWEHSIDADIDFAVTLIGSGDSFSLMGDNICSDTDNDRCDSNALMNSTITVTQDVAVTGENQNGDGYATEINFFNVDNTIYFDDAITENAENDVSASLDALFNLDTECVVLPNDYFQQGSSATVTINPGVYCFEQCPVYKNDCVDLPATIDSTIQFRSYNADDVFVFINRGDDEIVGPVFQINSNASFDVETYNVNPENIYWAVNGSTEMQESLRFVGSLLIENGNFELSDNGVDDDTCIQGRILVLDDDVSDLDNILFTTNSGCPSADMQLQ